MTVPTPAPTPEPQPDPAPAPAPTPAPTPQPDKGFPENTPVVQMSPEQQAAYWKHQSRQHEDRVKALGVTPEQLAELRAKAERTDALDYELSSVSEKAVTDAKKSADESARATWVPKLVEAEIRAAVAGRIEPAALANIVGPLDKTWFLAADGTVDTDKVTAYVDGIVPAKGDQQEQRRGPSPTGQGQRQGTPGSTTVGAGQDLWAQRHPKKATA